MAVLAKRLGDTGDDADFTAGSRAVAPGDFAGVIGLLRSKATTHELQFCEDFPG